MNKKIQMKTLINEIYNYFHLGEKILFSISLRKYFEILLDKKDMNDKHYIKRAASNITEPNLESILEPLIKLLSSASHNNCTDEIDNDFLRRLGSFLEKTKLTKIKEDLWFLGVGRKWPLELQEATTNQIQIKISEISDNFKSLKIPEMQRGFEWEEENVISYSRKLFETNFNIIEDFVFSRQGKDVLIYDGQQRLITIWMIGKALNGDSNFKIELHNFFENNFSERVEGLIQKIKVLLTKYDNKTISNFNNKTINIKICTRKAAESIYIKKHYGSIEKREKDINSFTANILVDFFKWKTIEDKFNGQQKLVKIFKNESLSNIDYLLSIISMMLKGGVKTMSVSYVHLNGARRNRNHYWDNVDSDKVKSLRVNAMNVYDSFTNLSTTKTFSSFLNFISDFLDISNSVLFNDRIAWMSMDNNIAINFSFSPQIPIDSCALIYNHIFSNLKYNKDFRINLNKKIEQMKLKESILNILMYKAIDNLFPNIKRNEMNYKEYWDEFQYDKRINKIYKILKESSWKDVANKLRALLSKSKLKMIENGFKKFDIDKAFLRAIFDRNMLAIEIITDEDPFIWSRLISWDYFPYINKEKKMKSIHSIHTKRRQKEDKSVAIRESDQKPYLGDVYLNKIREMTTKKKVKGDHFRNYQINFSSERLNEINEIIKKRYALIGKKYLDNISK